MREVAAEEVEKALRAETTPTISEGAAKKMIPSAEAADIAKKAAELTTERLAKKKIRR